MLNLYAAVSPCDPDRICVGFIGYSFHGIFKICWILIFVVPALDLILCQSVDFLLSSFSFFFLSFVISLLQWGIKLIYLIVRPFHM